MKRPGRGWSPAARIFRPPLRRAATIRVFPAVNRCIVRDGGRAGAARRRLRRCTSPGGSRAYTHRLQGAPVSTARSVVSARSGVFRVVASWVVLALPAAAGMAQAPPSAPRPFAAPVRPGAAERIVLAVHIDGEGPFHFLVDTGVDSSMLSPGRVRERALALYRSGSERVQGTTGVERLPWVLIRRRATAPIATCRVTP